ncbi:hypothetical protein BH23CHL2_BH23CHL2_14510 [soil metagenome]
MPTESTVEKERRSIPWTSIMIAGIAVIVASTMANLIVRSVGIRVADVPGGFEPLASAEPVVFASITYGLVAVIAFAVTRYFASNIRRAWLTVGLVGLALSFIPPLSLSGQEESNAAGIGILLVMHLVAAAIFIPTMLRLASE